MNEFDEIFEQKMKMGVYQYILLYAACALQFTNGSFQIILPVAIKKIQSEIFLNHHELTVLTSTYQWGVLSGGFVVGFLADHYGRHKVLLLNCIYGLLIFAWTYGPHNFTSLALLTFGFGLFSASHYVVLVTYLFEHLPAKTRGRITVIFKSFTTIGRTLGAEIIAFLMNPYQEGYWRAPIIATAFLVLTAFLPFLFTLRESLRFSYSSHDYVNLYANFNYILRLNAKYGLSGGERPEAITSDDISIIKTNTLLRKSAIKTESGVKLYLSRKYIYPNIALTLNRTLMQSCLTGFMTVFPQIFGTDDKALHLMTLIISGEYVGQIVCALIVDTKTFGRRRTMFLCNFFTAFFFFLIPMGFPELLVVVAFLTRLTAKCSLTCVEIYSAECYPIKIRAIAAGVNTLVVGTSLAFFPFIFNYFTAKGEAAIYVFLGTNAALAFVLAYFLAKDVAR